MFTDYYVNWSLTVFYAECVAMNLIYASFRVSFSEASLHLNFLFDTDLYSVVRWHTSRFNDSQCAALNIN